MPHLWPNLSDRLNHGWGGFYQHDDNDNHALFVLSHITIIVYFPLQLLTWWDQAILAI